MFFIVAWKITKSISFPVILHVYDINNKRIDALRIIENSKIEIDKIENKYTMNYHKHVQSNLHMKVKFAQIGKLTITRNPSSKFTCGCDNIVKKRKRKKEKERGKRKRNKETRMIILSNDALVSTCRTHDRQGE